MDWQKLGHRVLSDGSIFFLNDKPKNIPGWYNDGNLFRKILPECSHRNWIEAKCCQRNKVPSCDGNLININVCYTCTRSKNDN